jgi:hypothetical protein
MQTRLFATFAILLGVLASFLLLELTLRVATPSWLQERMRELNAGASYEFGTDQAWPVIRQGGAFRQFIPNSRFVVRHYEYEHTAAIDEFGARSTLYSSSNGEIIPFIGDSFTFGIGVRDSETFVSLIGERSPYRLVNLGVPGSALHNQLDVIETRHAELGHPGIYVFCIFMGNDLADIKRRYEQRTLVKNDNNNETGRGFLWRINNYAFHHAFIKRLYSIQFLRQKILFVAKHREIGRMNPVFQVMRTDTAYLDESIKYLREELKRLEDLSRRNGFEYVFVLIPDVHQVSPRRLKLKAQYYDLDVMALAPKRVSRMLSATLRDFEIAHIDITDCLSAEEFSESFYFVQDNHFTKAGHNWAAECMLRGGLKEMITNRLIPGDSEPDNHVQVIRPQSHPQHSLL